MQSSLTRSIEILSRTPNVLIAMLQDVSEEWISMNEGGESWSAYVIVGHLIYAEKADWIPRLDIILSDRSEKIFEPFDRFAQFEESKGKSLPQLSEEFKLLRNKNLQYLSSKNLTDTDLQKKGIHPAFGEITLSQLISTWTVHDLNHIAQISRVMAKQYKTEVGPWVAYLRILQS